MPPEVAQQYQDIMQRSQWQRAQLEQGGVGIRRGRASEMGIWWGMGLGMGTVQEGWEQRGPTRSPHPPTIHSQNTQPSWSGSCSSTRRLPGAWAMTAAG